MRGSVVTIRSMGCQTDRSRVDPCHLARTLRFAVREKQARSEQKLLLAHKELSAATDTVASAGGIVAEIVRHLLFNGVTSANKRMDLYHRELLQSNRRPVRLGIMLTLVWWLVLALLGVSCHSLGHLGPRPQACGRRGGHRTTRSCLHVWGGWLSRTL